MNPYRGVAGKIGGIIPAEVKKDSAVNIAPSFSKILFFLS